MSAKRVLFIGALPEPTTGQSIACQALLDALRVRHEVHVVNLSKPSFVSGADSWLRLRQMLGIMWGVVRGRAGAEVVYFTVSESKAGVMKDILIYALLLGKLDRVLIHLHGGAGMRVLMRPDGGVLRAMNAWFTRRLGGAIVLGPRHAPIYAGVLPRERVHEVPNFAEEAMFVPPSVVTDKFTDASTLRVLFLSNLIPGKGHLELLAAIETLEPAVRERLRVDFAGGFDTDAAGESFERAISRLPELHYHGVVRGDRKAALFREAHLFALPTYYPYEGQPISILEAYASGCAVLTTDHSGILDIFEPEVNGFLVEARSAESIARAIRRAVNAPGELGTIAARNREVAGRRFRVARFQQRLIGLIDAVPALAEAESRSHREH